MGRMENKSPAGSGMLGPGTPNRGSAAGPASYGDIKLSVPPHHPLSHLRGLPHRLPKRS